VAVSEGVEANVVIWDSATGKVRHTIGLMSPNVRAVALARDSRTLAVAMPGYVRLFDVVTGKTLVEERGHLAEVVDMRFSADGKQLISACSEGSVRVWDTATGRNLAARDLIVPYRPTRVVFQPDLKAVLAGGPEGLRDVPLDPDQPARTHFHPEEGSF